PRPRDRAPHSRPDRRARPDADQRPAPRLSEPESLLRRLAAEAIGTFALVFAGAGAIMVDAKTHQLGHVVVALRFGLVIMALIHAVGHISGAHFNAAVTLAFALTRGGGAPARLARHDRPR